MSDPKKPYNPAYGVFGLDNAPPPAEAKGEPRPSAPQGAPSEAQPMPRPEKPRNAAYGVFGLNDVPAPAKPETKPSVPRGPSDEIRAASPRAFNPIAPTVNFGTRQAVPPTEPEPTGAQEPPPLLPPQSPKAVPPEGSPAGAPQYIYVQSPPGPTAPQGGAAGKILWALVIILLALSGTTLYMLHSARQKLTLALDTHADELKSLTQRADASDVRYAQLSGDFRVTAKRLGLTQAELTRARQYAANIEREQRRSVNVLNAAIAKKASAQQLQAMQSESSAKMNQLSGSIQKGLEASQEALSGAKGELTGAIAHNHAELVALAHRTDRDYFEFHLDHKHARQKIGGVQVELMKTDSKMNLFTVNLYFDDKRTQRRNQAIDAPVFFYMEGASSPIELVVNHVGRNAIRGYISAPKGFITNTPNVLGARPSA